MIDFDGRTFRSIANSPGGDVGSDTVFRYHQRDRIVWATYQGGAVEFGTLIAYVLDDGSLDMRYQQVLADGSIKTGRCRSTPEVTPNGRIRLLEEWMWTEGGEGSGHSVAEEMS